MNKFNEATRTDGRNLQRVAFTPAEMELIVLLANHGEPPPSTTWDVVRGLVMGAAVVIVSIGRGAAWAEGCPLLEDVNGAGEILELNWTDWQLLRVNAAAQALDVDPAYFVRLAVVRGICAIFGPTPRASMYAARERTRIVNERN